MPNAQHVELVRAGAATLARWRRLHPGERLDLRGASLQGLDLRKANLQDADCKECSFAGSNLSHADLRHADMYAANLRRVDLRSADLRKTNLEDVRLEGARLAQARFGATTLRNTDFSGVKDLAKARHSGKSIFDDETLQKSQGLPHEFLHSIGVPDPPIIDVFLSYASKDEPTARKVAAALRSAGFTLFRSKESLASGDEWAEKIRRNLIQASEVWVICSTRSMTSTWVLAECGAAWVLKKTITPILVDLGPQALPDVVKKSQVVRLSGLAKAIKAIASRSRRASAKRTVGPRESRRPR